MPRIRLYIDEPLASAGSVSIQGDQHHYLTNVVRCKIGDSVAFFNGQDGEWLGLLTAQSKRETQIQIQEQTRKQAGVPDLHLLFAPIKRLRIDFLAQKATELGVSALRPVLTERTVASRINLQRLKSNAVEAAEQTGRLCVPAILEPQKLDDCLASWTHKRRLVFCDEAGDDPDKEWGGSAGRARPARDFLQEFVSDEQRIWAILIGPEGGFSPRERTLLRSQEFVVPISLGPRIMRADTAAMAAISVWQSVLGDWT